MKKTIYEEKSTIKVNSKEEKELHKKAFTFVIKDNISGKELLNKQTNIILGVCNDITESNDEVMATRQIVAVHCNKITRLMTIEGLSNLVQSLKKEEIEDAPGLIIAKLTKEGGDNE